ncbi:ABC transporter permease [Spiribacter halobius]|uniref:ABC transporter permease n=1 Tax=Sediminicurvatus halobius TaxID=2182432 RepID=A0A2U2MYM7_9GAMM|nr:ABC transporter permease [Spiribacter halobius]PWG61814.1 ABC transporter permease [Spiribacter halobius]UEX77654.1 ABC transporter permease [Spiribacter halobius]
MSSTQKLARASLWFYVLLVYGFVFAPILASFVFSLNADRFPTLPLAGLSFEWYREILNDPGVWTAFGNSVKVALVSGSVATFLGFGAAYTDYRFNFVGKKVYLALALLPPTVPLVIFGLAMLAFLSRVSLAGYLHSVMISHIVLCTPFAMALIRIRLAQMDPALEEAAWNLGASRWRAMASVVLPFAAPAVISAWCLTMAVSFDEFAIAWFVSGLNETVPVVVLQTLQGTVSPRINAIGSLVFSLSILLVVIAQVVYMRSGRQARTAQ